MSRDPSPHSLDWQAVVAALAWQDGSGSGSGPPSHPQTPQPHTPQTASASASASASAAASQPQSRALNSPATARDQQLMDLVQQMYARPPPPFSQYSPSSGVATPTTGVYPGYFPPNGHGQPGPSTAANRRVAPAPARTLSSAGVLQEAGSSSRRGTRANTAAPTTASTPALALDAEDAEDKRVRNTLASARFRAKKKAHVEHIERNIRALEAQHSELEVEVADLRKENGLLKDMVQLKYGSGVGNVRR